MMISIRLRRQLSDVIAIPARDVPTGVTLYRVGESTARPRWPWQAQPKAENVEYRLYGEGGEPTVYIEGSDSPGYDWCLDPDELVVVGRPAEMPKTNPDEVTHVVGTIQHWFDRLRIKVPRALCGVSLAGDRAAPELGPDAPVCPACLARG